MIYSAALCTFAGFATALGALAVIAKGGIHKEKMAFFQGFAAGVMLSVSFMDLLAESYENYNIYMPRPKAAWSVLSLVLCGAVIGAALARLSTPQMNEGEERDVFTVRKMAVLTTVVMVLHNMPEGMLTMFAGAQDMDFGLKMAVAVALHNIPEGMAIAGPVLYTTKSPSKAFSQAFWAGMAEPIGGIGTYLLLKNFISRAFINGLMPIIGGIMIQTAVFQLIPSAIKISNIKHTIYGIIIGTMVMSIGLLLF